MARQIKRGQEGFTLIEIISVLVLLGILAAVAVPRFMDMQAAARERAAQATVHEIQARIYQVFANRLLQGDSCDVAQTAAITVSATAGTPFADLAGDDNIKLTLTDADPKVEFTFTQSGVDYANDSGWTIVTQPEMFLPSCS